MTAADHGSPARYGSASGHGSDSGHGTPPDHAGRLTTAFRTSLRTLRQQARTAPEGARRALRGPGPERDLLVQSLKASGAALLAWTVAHLLLADPMALMAPWVALVLVRTTVYGSLLSAVRQFGAICVGTLLASGAQAATGDTLAALALSVPVLMLLANWPLFGDQGDFAATTAVFTIATGAVGAAAVGHRLGQAALGAAVGVMVNAFVLPPVHLRDVRESLAAVARVSGDTLRSVADDLRREEWDDAVRARWAYAPDTLDRRVEALRSARGWSQESLRLTTGWLRFFHRGPLDAPPVGEDDRWTRIAGHVTALTRVLATAADETREPAAPGQEALLGYADMLDLLGDACLTEGRRLMDLRAEKPAPALDQESRRALEGLDRRLRESLRDHAAVGTTRTAVLGALLLHAQDVWAQALPGMRHGDTDHRETGQEQEHPHIPPR